MASWRHSRMPATRGCQPPRMHKKAEMSHMDTHATAGYQPAAMQSEGFFAYTVLFIRGSSLVHDVMRTEMGLVVVNELLELEMY